MVIRVRVTGYEKAAHTAKVIVDSGAFAGCKAQYLIRQDLIVWKKMAQPFPRNYDPKCIERAIREAVRDYLEDSGGT